MKLQPERKSLRIERSRATICVVDDDMSARESLEGLLRSHGMRVITFGSAADFLSCLPSEAPDCLILDLDLPGLSGLELQQELGRGRADIPIVFLSGQGRILDSVQAVKAGAVDFLSKPVGETELLAAIQEGIDRTRPLRAYCSAPRFLDFVGESPALRNVWRQIELVAQTQATVLITGESGTGKELVARAVHRCSVRRDRPLIKVNCGAIPDALFESEIFGHVRGSFTGAVRDRAGRFEQAQGGTLFLDEIGEVPLAMQVKLLRVLQERVVDRVGDVQSRQLDVRVIAGTSRDLRLEVNAGRFRRDLYYRLNVFPIHNPSLRERREDVPPLVWHFAKYFGVEMNKTIRNIPAPMMEALVAYHWPGNVRELQNFVQRALIFSPGDTLCMPPGDMGQSPRLTTHECHSLEQIERDHILRTLVATHWRVGGPRGAAVRLGLKRTTLLSRMEKLGISRRESFPVVPAPASPFLETARVEGQNIEGAAFL